MIVCSIVHCDTHKTPGEGKIMNRTAYGIWMMVAAFLGCLVAGSAAMAAQKEAIATSLPVYPEVTFLMEKEIRNIPLFGDDSVVTDQEPDEEWHQHNPQHRQDVRQVPDPRGGPGVGFGAIHLPRLPSPHATVR